MVRKHTLNAEELVGKEKFTDPPNFVENFDYYLEKRRKRRKMFGRG